MEGDLILCIKESHIQSLKNTLITRVDLWCEKRGPGGLVPLTQIDINVNTVLVGTVTYISNS